LGAVTATDYAERARQFEEVRTAAALPLFHPRFPDVEVPGAVTVVVVPEGVAPRPVPSEDLLRAVGEWIDRARSVGTEVVVTGPVLFEVVVRARLELRPEANFAAAIERARARLDAFSTRGAGGSAGTSSRRGSTARYSTIPSARWWPSPGCRSMSRGARSTR
jgi:hypothetical protein